ncbi:Flp pilus assembly pilin Flp [Catenibacillus scindens]|uniref:Flp pilus assembly pilin Flp n=1 Tax=Catenibacillus scindens TaxID=673271 RepID=A0A7W8M599_9FIRM|nr:Flp1 family type IVb pilin [Catenibacillus scindens]MBB5264714.1 Flp pilus assembly pilin Flp [Catenibacillus scindens]
MRYALWRFKQDLLEKMMKEEKGAAEIVAIIVVIVIIVAVAYIFRDGLTKAMNNIMKQLNTFIGVE